MKKELFVHTIFFVSLFLLITAFKSYFNVVYLYFWLGGLIGTILPDLDHLIYVYFLRPYELTSLRTQSLVQKGELWSTLNLLAITRSERRHLIFHTITFQAIFLLFGFFVLSSSGSLVGSGLVVAFLLHLLIDQLIDFLTLDHIQNWLYQLNFSLTREKTVFYLVFQLIVLLVFSFLF